MSDATGGLATSLLLAFRDLVQPVLDAVDSPEAMEYFWYESGWDVRLDDVALAAIEQAFPLAVDKQRIEQAADAVRETLRTGTAPSPDQIAALADVVVDLASNLTSFTPSALGSLPAPLADPATWEDAGEQLFDRLVERYLRLHQPLAYALVLATGCISYQAQAPGTPLRVPYTRVVLDWDQLEALFDRPATALARAYHWGDATTPFDHQRLLANLSLVLRTLGLSTAPAMPPVQLEPGLDPQVLADVRRDADGLRVTLLRGVLFGQHATYEVGADLLPASPGAATDPTGLVLRPRLDGSLSQSIPLGPSLAVTATVTAAVGDVLAVELFPGLTRLAGGDVALGVSVEIAGTGTDPWYPVGTPGHARIEVRNPRLKVSLEGSVGDPELRVTLSLAGSGGGTGGSSGGAGGATGAGCRVVIPLGDADSFVHDAVGTNDVVVELSPEVVWSSRSGFGVDGRSTPQLTLPTNIQLGLFTIHALQISLGTTGSNGRKGFGLQAGFDVSGSIGPVEAAVQRMGFAFTLTPYSQDDLRALPPGASRPALGTLDVGLDFLPPIGAGLAVDAAGVITGGGFLSHDPRSGLYAGVLELSIHESLTLKAIGLISTRLPDGSPGYSLLILITAEDFPPIPLFLGFSLLGVGGLIGVHRTVDQQAIQQGLRADTLSSVLFPADPIANAPAVIRALSAVFPARRGSYLVGLMAKIGRTTPPITMDLAVVYEFGARRRLVVLGRISSDMPNAQEDLVRIRLDAVGVVDLDAGSVSIDAVLVDSRLAYKYALSGAMALRAQRGHGPGTGFVLAIGGFNPHFTPPPGVPALDRVAIALSSGDNPRLRCEAYFALTSNTVQFGARAQLHAAAYGFAIDGDVGFDVLVQRHPFGFIADFHASVQLSYGSTHLFTVTVDGTLQGPRPLRVSGSASFSVFWCDFTIRFDRTLIDGEQPPLPPGPDPAAELRRALTDPGNWATRASANRAPGVSLRHRTADGAVLVDPLGVLVVSQTVLPLNTSRPIEVYGDAPVAQPRSFTVTVTLAGLQKQAPVLDDFAPAQYFALTDDEKLSGPSFEQLQSGIVLGAAEPVFDPQQIVGASLEYQTLVVNDLTEPAAPLPDPYQPDASRVGLQLQLGALQSATSRTAGRARFRDPAAPAAATMSTQRWAAVPVTDDTVDADALATATTWSQAIAVAQARSASPGQDGGAAPTIAGQWQLVPVFGGSGA
jgi:Family of unknown function (DUF6603)